jgi:transcriptional regulator with XRE-family HTH domain
VPSPHRPANRQLIAVLNAARAEKRVVQTELAARLGKPPSYVAKIELGDRRLDVIEFIEYARALGVSPTTLFKRVLAAINLLESTELP